MMFITKFAIKILLYMIDLSLTIIESKIFYED